ncbi:hypothetical protein L218DRAFT_78283 [Marasmius fiardii PR-910]|nr:hypothetical protein L218DRAFT_78283 [Marasmius fiardii PR-910]
MEDASLPTQASTVADSNAIPAASGTTADGSLVVDAGSLATTVDQGKAEDREHEAKVDEGPVVDPGNLQGTEDQQSASQDSVRNAEESTLSVEKAPLEEDKQPSASPPVEVQSPEQAVEQAVEQAQVEALQFEKDTASAVDDGSAIHPAPGTVEEESSVVDVGSLAASVGQEQPPNNISTESKIDEGLVVDADNSQTVKGQQPLVSRDAARDAKENAPSLADTPLWDEIQPSDSLPMELESSKGMVEDNQAETVSPEGSALLPTQASTVADSNTIPPASGIVADESLVVDAGGLTASKQEESGKDSDAYLNVGGLVVDAGNSQIAEDQEQLASKDTVQGAASSSAEDAPLSDDKQSSDNPPVEPQSSEQVNSVQESQIEALPPKEDVSVSTEPSIVADDSAIPPASGTVADESLVVDAGSLTTINQQQSVDKSSTGSKVDEGLEVDAGRPQIAEWGQSAEGHTVQDDVSNQVEPSRSANDMNSYTKFTTNDTAVNDAEKPEDEFVEQQTEAVQATAKEEPVGGGEDAPRESKAVDVLPIVSDTAAQETGALGSGNSESVTGEQGTSNHPTDSGVPAQVPDHPVKDVAANLIDGKDCVTEGESKQGTDVSVLQESLLGSRTVDGKVSTAPDNAVSEIPEEVDSVPTAGEQGNSDAFADSGTLDERRDESIKLVEAKALDVEEAMTEGKTQEATTVGSFESSPESKVIDALPAAPDTIVSDKALEGNKTVRVSQDDVGTPADEASEQMSSKIVEQQVAVESKAAPEVNRQAEGELKEDPIIQEIDVLPAAPDTTLPEPKGGEAKPVDEAPPEPGLTTNNADFDPAPPDASTSATEATTTNESENKPLDADSGSVPSQDESVIRLLPDRPVPESEPSAESSAEVLLDKTQISDKDESAVTEAITDLQSSIPDGKETPGSIEAGVKAKRPDEPAPLHTEDIQDDGEATSEVRETADGTLSAAGPLETKNILPAALGPDVHEDQAEERARVEISDTADADVTGGEYEQETHVDENVIPYNPAAAVDQTTVNAPAQTVEEEQVAKQGQETLAVPSQTISQEDSDNISEATVSGIPLDVKIQDSTSGEAKPHLEVTEEIERPKSPWTPSYSITNQGPGTEDVPEIKSISETKPADEPASVVNEVPSVNIVAPSALHVEGITVEDKLAQTQSQKNDTVTDDCQRPKSFWTPSYSVSRQGSPAPPAVEEATKQEESHPDDAAPSDKDVPDGAPVAESMSEGGQHSETPELAALPDSQAVKDEVEAPSHNQANRNGPTQSNSQVQESGLEAQQHDLPPVNVSKPQEELVEVEEPSGDATLKASSSAEDSSASVRSTSLWTQSYSVSVQGSPQPPSRELPTEAPVESQSIQSKEEKDELPNQDLHGTSTVTSPSQGEHATPAINRTAPKAPGREETTADDYSRSDDRIIVADVSALKALAVTSPDEVEAPSEQSQSQADTVARTATITPDTQPVSQEREQQSEVADVASSETLENTNVNELLPTLEIPAVAPEPESKLPWTSSYSVTKQGRDTPPENIVATSAVSQPDPKDTEVLSASTIADSNNVRSLTVDTSTSPEDTPQRPRSPWTPSYSVMRQGAASTDALNEDAELAELEQLPVSVAQNAEALTDGEQAKSDLGSEPFPTSESYEEEGSLTSLDTVTGSRDAPSSPSGRSRLESTASSLMFPGGWYSRPPPGRASLDNAKGEFVASKQSSPPPVQLPPELPEETVAVSTSVGTNEEIPAKEEKKSKWCTIM